MNFCSEEELGKLLAWAEEHAASCKMKYGGAIGGFYTYSFTPTNLGTVSKVQCACGEKYDATDYDGW